jgi:hypothetical protein
MGIQHLSFEIPFAKLRPFIDHWASRYRDNDNDKRLYERHIKADLSRADVLIELFDWKNGGGGKIAQKKLDSIYANYLSCWIEDSELETRYLDPDNDGGPIWNIFYLHCRLPELYPIYDQHAYRAMLYIQNGAICEEKDDLNRKPRPFVYESYKIYRRFVGQIARETKLNLRTVDRALYTFGQFLKRARPYR